jgi:hypothetical protein
MLRAGVRRGLSQVNIFHETDREDAAELARDDGKLLAKALDQNMPPFHPAALLAVDSLLGGSTGIRTEIPRACLTHIDGRPALTIDQLMKHGTLDQFSPLLPDVPFSVIIGRLRSAFKSCDHSFLFAVSISSLGNVGTIGLVGTYGWPGTTEKDHGELPHG